MKSSKKNDPLGFSFFTARFHLDKKIKQKANESKDIY